MRRVTTSTRPLLVALALAVLVPCSCGGSKSSSGSGGDAGADVGPGDDVAPDASADEGAHGDAAPSDAASTPDSNYADPALWLCGANATHDYCLDPLAVTTIHADLSQTTSTPAPAADPALDCFYVYPSVDITSAAGNEKDFSNLPDILDPVREQAAPFSQVCKVYAPLYHQATYQSYLSATGNQYLEIAYADVAAAFAEYMSSYNHGRSFVLLGHSQGSHMLRRLIQRVIEPAPAVEGQMALAILAGTLGDVMVPKGQLVGASFQSTPLCTSATQRGCVLTFSTFAKGYEPTSSYPAFTMPAGDDVGCTNPGAPAGGKATLADSLFFTQFQNATLDPPQTSGVTTPFASYPGFYTGECVQSAGGYSFFEVDLAAAAGDQRSNPIPFSNAYYTPSVIGLHLLDYAFPLGDLLAAVTARSSGVDAGSGDAASD